MLCFVVVNILFPHIFICLHAALVIEMKTFKISSCVYPHTSN